MLLRARLSNLSKQYFMHYANCVMIALLIRAKFVGTAFALMLIRVYLVLSIIPQTTTINVILINQRLAATYAKQ